jgi:predicted nuclease of predicted toxin-antitoxin system
MKLKLDENLPVTLAVRLREIGRDADTVRDEGLTGQSDETVWDAAQREGRLLVTQDLDFSDARRFAPGTHCGILLVRIPDRDQWRVSDYVVGWFAASESQSWSGCVVVATPHRIRVLRPTASPTSKLAELRAKAERGSAPSMAVLGISLLKGDDGIPVDHEQAFHWLSLAAAKGVPRARYHLGRMYLLGLGTHQDSDRARELFTLAAQRGEFLACVDLARLELSLNHEEEAFRWYKLASDQAGRVAPCDELEEAKAFVASHRPAL